MPDVYFDGASKEIRLTEVGSYSAGEIYSDWKVWAANPANAGWPRAFDTTGGDPVGVGHDVSPYFFVRNDTGWSVKMPAETGEIVIIGNLFQRDPSQDMYNPTEGFTTFLRLQVSTQSTVKTVETSTGGLTIDQDALISKISKKVNLLVAS